MVVHPDLPRLLRDAGVDVDRLLEEQPDFFLDAWKTVWIDRDAHIASVQVFSEAFGVAMLGPFTHSELGDVLIIVGRSGRPVSRVRTLPPDDWPGWIESGVTYPGP